MLRPSRKRFEQKTILVKRGLLASEAGPRHPPQAPVVTISPEPRSQFVKALGKIARGAARFVESCANRAKLQWLVHAAAGARRKGLGWCEAGKSGACRCGGSHSG